MNACKMADGDVIVFFQKRVWDEVNGRLLRTERVIPEAIKDIENGFIDTGVAKLQTLLTPAKS